MTQNQRIILNVVATYARSLYALVCGLYTSRWALMALGKVDYGIYGVVGGLTAFVTFLNSLMSAAVGRFYAVSVGAAKKNENVDEGLDECRRWFNSALLIHFVLPVMLITIGYPTGIWAIYDFLKIPVDRIHDCVWVWRFTCFSCFVGMCTVPFQAMFTAKQEIAELTIYSVISTTINVLCLYYMVSNPGIWLKGYAACMCVVAAVPRLIIMVRALSIFPECRFKLSYLWDRSRFNQLLAYASAESVGLFAQICSVQGMAILVNKGLDAARNATLTLSNTVTNQTMTLAGSFNSALYPAIANAVGEKKDAYVRVLTFRACSFSMLAFMVFMLPLSLELDYVLRLWLKNPPDRLASLVLMLFVGGIIDRGTDGYWMAILSYGKIARFRTAEAGACFVSLIVSGVLIFMLGFDIESVGWGMIACRVLQTVVRVCYGRLLCGLSARCWLFRILCPALVAALVALVPGYVLTLFVSPSFCRVFMTTIAVELTFLPLVWFVVLGVDEREFVRDRLRRVLNKFFS